MTSRTLVRLGARRYLSSLGTQLRCEKGLPLPRSHAHAQTPLGHPRAQALRLVFSRNVAAACSSEDGGEGTEERGEKGVKGKGQSSR